MTATVARLSVRFRPRRLPLVACAALATGHVVPSLLAALLRIAPDRLARLEAARSRNAFLVVGATGDLPWVDGIDYLGRDPDAPALFVPTATRPDVPMALFERAVVRRARATPELASVQRWAVSFSPRLIVPAPGTRLLTAGAVTSYLADSSAKGDSR